MPILHWLNDEEARKTSNQIPYRLLNADPNLSIGDPDSENMLIQGDNLEALKALLPYYAGQIKCIYIDPPYNTGSAFEHYDDNIEHSTWLSIMYPRLEMLRELLSEDGSIWVSIDDNEGHYLKVLMDEVFTRKNFVRNIVWQKKYTIANDSTGIPDSHDHILVYRKTEKFLRNLLPRTEKQNKLYKYNDEDGRGFWRTDNLSVKTYSEAYDYEIINPNTGKAYKPPAGRCWFTSKERMQKLIDENRVFWGKGNKGAPQLKRYLNEVQQGVVPMSWWTHEEAGHNDESRKEQKVFFGEEAFSTPKPERLLKHILEIATKTDDLILDSFLGSGTSSAVAHKMGRRYIGIEMGEHAITHCFPRLKKVVEGEQGGISKAVNWEGGGGFHFYRLGESIFDEQGKINPKVTFKALAAHVWFSETYTPLLITPHTPLLGVHGETAFYLLFNGILGDKTPEGGNVLTPRVLHELPQHTGKKVVYGEMSMLDDGTLHKKDITFKHIPYDIKAN